MLRSELFSADQLKHHAVSLAGSHSIDRRPAKDRLLPRLAENERVLANAYGVVTAVATPSQRILPAEVWLLDNFYLIEQQIALARQHLPRGFSRQLPRLAGGPLAGFPRIYAVALELISHQDGRIDRDNAAAFLAAYQTAEPLSLGELWAFPIMLRLALLENVRRVGVRIARRREEQNVAIAWADRMLAVAEEEPKQLTHVLAEFADADVPMTAPFVEDFYARLQSQGSALAFVQTWLEHRLSEQGVRAVQLLEAAGLTAAADQISIANSVGSLRFISAMDWGKFVEELSLVEHILRLDPAEVYASQDFPTRDRYRHAVETVASGSVHSELEVAQTAITFAQTAARRAGSEDRTAHVGHYLVGEGRPMLERAMDSKVPLMVRATRVTRPFRVFLYLAPILVLTLLAVAFLLSYVAAFDGGYGWSVFFAIIGLVSASALVVPIVNTLITITVPPRVLPRLDLSDGIPADYRTLVVVPTLLGRGEDVAGLLEALEIRYLGNRDPNLFFALLTDFRDATERVQPGDETLVGLARAGIEALNDTYSEDRPGIFYLFHRPRVWNPHDRVWMGHERKRGKLEQFNALLLQARSGEAQSRQGADAANEAFSDIVGDRSVLGTIRYVITLDTDTQLPRDAARTLIGNMAHPLNRPLYDEKKGRVVDGYAILQPRTSISLTSTSGSWFTRLFAGEPGIDPYTREVSDVYQDLFGEGSFVGKGIYDLEAFSRAVGGRFPENLILSHDLLESGYARSALVADVDLIEDHPVSYAAEASRRHRWARGDWQLAGWLLPRVQGPDGARLPNPLSLLSVWKLLDNLRRSLVPPALVALLLGGWLWGSGPAWLWEALVAGVLFLPASLTAAIELIRKPEERGWPVHLAVTGKSAVRPLVRALLMLVFLPYDALVYLDAILRSGVKMLFTRRGMMLWHTPSYSRRNARRTPQGFLLEMWIAPVLAVVLAVVLAFAANTRLTDWPFVAPVLVLWMVSPIVGWWISRPVRPPAAGLNDQQQAFLRALARRTWRYFSDFVGPEHNWLPPDNYQEYPTPTVAPRTSPTNMGMALLANLVAHDFGYISTGEFLRRTDRTLRTMEKLERFRGHFYNWYDTHTLLPLHPQYISSVDSGNLAGSLLALRVGLSELKTQPVLNPRTFSGLRDTLAALAVHTPSLAAPEVERQMKFLQSTLHSVNDAEETPATAEALLEDLCRGANALVATPSAANSGEFKYWSRALNRQCRRFRDDLQSLVPRPEDYDEFPTLEEVAAATSVPDQTEHRSSLAGSVAEKRLGIIDSLISRCLDLSAMDFDFLYDPARDLLSIGYDMGERRRDPSWYDLLASEARLTSFLLIAEGQVPQKHWFALGRLLTSHGGDTSLISWSGSMFEYLLPRLFLPSYENTPVAGGAGTGSASESASYAPINTSFAGLSMFRGNGHRTFYGEGPVPEAPEVLWRFPRNGGMSSPSSEGGETRIWAGTGWTGQPVVVEREGGAQIMFGAYDRAVHFLDATTGKRVLSDLPTGDIIKGSVMVDPDGYPLLYTGSRDNYFRIVALDRPEATVLWKINANQVPNPVWNNDWDSSAVIVGDYLFEGGENSYFFIIKLNRGFDDQGRVKVSPKVVLAFPGYTDKLLSDLGDRNVSIESSPAVHLDRAKGDRVYFANSGGLVQGLDISALGLSKAGYGPAGQAPGTWDDAPPATTKGWGPVAGAAAGMMDIETARGQKSAVGAARVRPTPPLPDPADARFPLVFSFWAGDDVDASIVVDEEGMLYVGAELERTLPRSKRVGQLMKLDPYRSGSALVWSIHDNRVGGKGGIWATAALHGEMLYVPTHSGRLLGVSKSSGQIVWEKEFPYHAWSSPAVVDSTLIVADVEGYLHAYDISDPAVDPPELWRVRTPSGGAIESTPAVWRGRIYVGSRDGFFYCFGDKVASR